MPEKTGEQLLNEFYKSTSAHHKKARSKTSKPKKYEYKVIEIGSFDARRGYKRCNPRGVTVALENYSPATSDFWRDRAGRLFVRLTSLGYVCTLEATRKDGRLISDDDLDGSFSIFISDLIFNWVIEGVDDTPEFCYE